MNTISQPYLAWEHVLQQPIKRLVRKPAGVEGADYAYLGIEFYSGDILNLGMPHEEFEVCQVDYLVKPEHDLIEGRRYSSLDGRNLRAVIYYLDSSGPNYFAVLDDGSYLTSYHCFNYTAFAFAYFREWRSSDCSRLAWGRVQLRKEKFFNAWNHMQIDPFSVYA
jgi:hypothetical protein